MDLPLPLAYRPGWPLALAADPAMARLYAAACTEGDPEADVAILACEGAEGRWIGRGIEGGAAAVPDAPQPLRALLAAAAEPPPWWDERVALAGCRGFHGHSRLFIGAFVGAVLIEGFSTLIARSFAITGRLVDSGVRRLQQNNRHVLEIFMPGGLAPEGEGWKLSVRIRLMHARLRLLLARSPEWDRPAWGAPVSAAHMAYASAVFSGGLLVRARQIGVRLAAEEEAGFMMVWRRSAALMGVPAALQCATVAEALRLRDTALRLEPPPEEESILLANALVNSAPLLIGLEEPAKRRAMARRIYRVSRAMIGDGLADALRFPPSRAFGVLALLRAQARLDGWARRLLPGWEAWTRRDQFTLMATLSAEMPGGLTYRMPGALHAERDREG